MEELLPCPFCGDEDELTFGHDVRTDIGAVYCIHCGAEGPSASSQEEAARLWNRRIVYGVPKAFADAFDEEDEG